MLVPLIVACALFMENLDSAIVSTSLPAIARDLAVDPVSLKLAFTSYIISIAVFTPLSGWTADRLGARTVFRAAIVVFTAGSVLCALASSLEGFVAARIVQGMGGSMMVPVGRLILLKSVEKREYLRAMSWLTVPALIGPVMGPPLGGFITTYFEWRWIFWINVPIGLVGLALVTRFIPDIREAAPRRLDVPGFLLLGIGLAGLVFGISASGIGLLPGPLVASLAVGGAISLLFYVRHALRVPHPLIDLALLKVHTLRASIVGGSLFRIGVGATPFLLPLLFQVGFGMTAFQSGLLTFTTAVGAITMKLTAPAILRRFGFRTRAHRQYPRLVRLRGLSGLVHAIDARPPDRGDPARRRLLPLAAVHRAQCTRLLRPRTLRHGPGDLALRGRAAGLDRDRGRHRRRHARVRAVQPGRRRRWSPPTSCRPSSRSPSLVPCRR